MSRPVAALAIVLSAAVLVSSAVVIAELVTNAPRAEANVPSATIPLFEFERQAQLHCPDDSIVWATAGTGTYDSGSNRWYGRTSSGAFGCLHDAENAGYRARRVER